MENETDESVDVILLSINNVVNRLNIHSLSRKNLYFYTNYLLFNIKLYVFSVRGKDTIIVQSRLICKKSLHPGPSQWSKQCSSKQTSNQFAPIQKCFASLNHYYIALQSFTTQQLFSSSASTVSSWWCWFYKDELEETTRRCSN